MDGLRIDALRNFMHIIDDDEDGVASVGEITNGLNAQIIPAIQHHIAHFRIEPIAEEQVRTWDANGDGMIDEHELGDMMMECFHQLTRYQFTPPKRRFWKDEHTFQNAGFEAFFNVL